ncbi:MAG: hypothetical protein AAGL98_00200 [Planctomycetota bacterium]
MKKYLDTFRGAVLAAFVALAALLPSEAALAQVVTQLPAYININTVYDFGNGPQEIRTLQGNAWMFTSQGSGVGSTSGASTTLTLTATPTTPPCVGCIISGAGITSGTTVAAFNGTTTITLSAAMTVAASTPLAWGAACPSYSSISGIAPSPNIALQPGGLDMPLYTQSRICGIANNGPGATVLPFQIGAH